MILMVGKHLPDYDHPNLGRLVTPRSKHRLAWTDARRDWACDNDAYLAWDHDAYVRMLDDVYRAPTDRLKFITAPDVVADWPATVDLFRHWWRSVERVGPVAIVLQDGATASSVPWDAIDAVFVGGTTEWKMNRDAEALILEARWREKWVHVGRVNTWRRLKWARSHGVDSVDGTKYARFTDTYLARDLDAIASPVQSHLWSSTEAADAD